MVYPDCVRVSNRGLSASRPTPTRFGVRAAAEEKKPAQAAEKIGVADTFVRFAENEEGYVILGCRTANESVDREWMLLDVGMTLQKGVAPQKITRDDIKLVTPDRKVIPCCRERQSDRDLLCTMTRRGETSP